MERGRITVFAVISAVLIAAGVLFALLFAGSTKYRAEIILPDTPSASPSPDGSYGFGASETVDVTPETVQAVIATLKRPDSYFRTLCVESMWDNGSAEYNVSMWVKGDCVRLSVSSEKWDEVKNILMDGEQVSIWYGDDPTGRFTVGRGAFESGSALGDELGMIPTYESVLTLEAGSITDAGYVDRDGPRIMVAAVDAALGYVWYYYVSADTGLLEAAEALDGDRLIYRMTADPAELNAPDDSMFVLDDSTV